LPKLIIFGQLHLGYMKTGGRPLRLLVTTLVPISAGNAVYISSIRAFLSETPK